MKTFSPSDAAFEGFRLVQQKPVAVLAWAVAYIVMYIVIGGLALLMFGAQFVNMAQYSGQTTVPPDVAMSMVGSFGLIAILAIPIGLIVTAVFLNAVLRAVITPNDSGFFYLRLGGDELRVAFLFFIYILLFLAAYIVVIIAVVVVGLIAAAVGPQARIAVVVIGAIAIFCAWIWVAVRLSLAAPLTFARKKLDIFGSWDATRGKFWSLFGCYLLTFVFGILLALLSYVISLSLGAVISGNWSGLNTMFNPHAMMANGGLNTLTHLFTIGVIVQVIVSSLIGAVSRVVMYAPLGAAYKALAAPDDSAAVF